jgi:hypothetical protein
VGGLFAGLVLRALVDDLAVVHVQLARVHGVSTRDGLHMQVGDPMEVGQRKGKAFSLCRRDKLIDINRMNRLIAILIATTVAQWFIASGEAGQKDIGHHDHPSWISMPAMVSMLMNDTGAYDDDACATVPQDGIGGSVNLAPPSLPHAPAFWKISCNSRSISRPLLAA